MNFQRFKIPSFVALMILAITARADTTISSGNTTDQTLASGNLTVTSNGNLTIADGNVAITVTGNGTIVNNGIIDQAGTVAGNTAGRGIDLNTAHVTLTVTNNAGALVETADADVFRANKPTDVVTLNNYGSLISYNASAGGSQAVDFNSVTASGSNVVNNYSGGLLEAYNADAVRPGVNGYVYNDGTIKSIITDTVNGSGSDGIDAQTNTGVTIVNGNALSGDTANNSSNVALIEGGRHGITGGNTDTTTNGAFVMTITNNAGGTIQGDNGSGINIDGFNGNEVVTIVNYGNITGDGVTADGDGVDVDGLVHLTNYGNIISKNAFDDASEGVTVGGGTIDNYGLIEGSISTPGNNTGVGRGITIAGVDKDSNDNPIPVQAPYAATTITNETGGQIIGDSDSGIAFTSALSSGFTHTINNDAGALIRGSGTTVAAIRTGGDMVIINNAGTIDGSASGQSISGGTGGIAVNITGNSASVLGDIIGAAGAANTMTISAGAGNSFAFANNIVNFNTVTVSTGSFALNGGITFALNGATAGSATGYGQLVFNSAETLTLGSGSLLNLRLNFTPTVGEQFTLIDMVNGTLSGTFANLADGGTYTQNGIDFTASYEGGGGNDLVLTVTAIPEPATTAALLAGLAGAAVFVLRRRRTK